MKMKHFSIVAALSFLSWFGAIPALAQFPTSCSNSMLRGNYGFTVNGKIIPPGGVGFVAQQGVALQHFDGAGHFVAVDFIMTNSVPTTNQPGTAVNSNGFRINESGTYTVNPDCTGKLTLNTYTIYNTLASTIQIKFVLDRGGKEVREVVKSITAYPPSGKVNITATILAKGEKLEPPDDTD